MFGVNIQKLKEKGDIDGLINALLNEKNWEIRRSAAIALGELKASAAIEPLGKAIRDINEEVRRSVVMALCKIGGDRTFELLRPALADGSIHVRRVLASALTLYGPREPLLMLLRDDDKEVRDTAESALKTFEKNVHLFQTLELLKNDFGVTNVGLPAHGEVKWGFFGKGSDRIAQQLNQPEVCWKTLREFRDSKAIAFDRLCIVSGGKPYIALNSKPPFAIVISLDDNGIADLIKLIVNEHLNSTDKMPSVVDFEGAWMLDMPK